MIRSTLAAPLALAFALGAGRALAQSGVPDVAHWSLDGDAQDVSGNDHHGTAVGAELTEDRFGNPDAAYVFDGSARIDVPDAPGLTLGSDRFTIMAWVRLDQFGADGGYYTLGHSSGQGNTSKWILWLADDAISFIAGPSSGSHWRHLGNFPFQLDTWYHVAVRSDGLLTAFVNGVPLTDPSPDASPSIPDPNAPLQLGTAEDGHPARLLRGALDDVRIYRSALSDQEIGDLVNLLVPYCHGLGCPCGNDDPSAGCAHGGGSGCLLRATGVASVSADDLVLHASGSVAGQPGLFFQGDDALPGVAFGDGLRCAGGSVVRLEVVHADGQGQASSSVGIVGPGGVSAGDTKRYQWWYRDAGGSPCGSGFNLSNGLEVSWAP